MKMDKKRKAVIVGFFLFFMLMGVCSLVTKGIYTAGLPQVTAGAGQEMSLYHPVSVMGVVETGQEYGIYAPAGLRVRAIACQKGDSFQAGDGLIQLDTADLEHTLAGRELERQRLLLQQQEAESADAASRQAEEQALRRALEDYEAAVRAGELQTSRAGLDDLAAQEILGKLRREQEQVKKELAQAQERLRQAQNGQQEQAGSVSGGDKEDAGADIAALSQQCEELWQQASQLQAQIEQQEQAVIAAARAAQDAHQAYAEQLRAAGRNVEDARGAASGDRQAAAELAEQEQAYLEQEIEQLRELLDADGWVCAGEDGRVTELCVEVGQRTSDTAWLLYTPDDGMRQLRARLPEEQAKYVTIGTRMQLGYETVSRGKQSGEEVVSYMEAREDGSAELLMDVTGLELELGQQVKLESTWQSESYSLVIPLSALYRDANNSDYIYVLRQQNGILGLEWHAQVMYVEVADQNSRYAAVESPALSGDTRIILTASAALKDNAVVRLVE